MGYIRVGNTFINTEKIAYMQFEPSNSRAKLCFAGTEKSDNIILKDEEALAVFKFFEGLEGTEKLLMGTSNDDMEAYKNKVKSGDADNDPPPYPLVLGVKR